MKKTSSQKKSAFSLIELSIVLIIIGLLIAGITGGASLIKSSELRSVMGEARGFAVAVNAFYSQYNALPGDYSTQPIGSAGTGNGNGRIEYYAAATGNGDSPTLWESANAWATLKQIGAIDSVTEIDIANMDPDNSVIFGTHAPASKIKSSGWIFGNNSDSQNIVVLTGAVSTTDAASEPSDVVSLSITPSDALSIDSKIDDGVATTGNIRGILTNCITDASTTYRTTLTTKECALSYRVDVNL